MAQMKIVEIDINELHPYENNPRDNAGAVDVVAASIKEFGFKVPIVIDANNIIIAGHTRLKAAQKLGLENVPCIVAADLTPEQAKALRLADNKVSEFAEWDFNALAKELSELEMSMEQFGFAFDEIDPDEFGEDFSLADGDKSEFEQITFTLHKEQAELIRYALEIVDECSETFGNTNKNGNALYEVIKQWSEMKSK